MSSLLQSVGVQLPLLLVYLIGIALAIVQMQRLPRVALPAVAGLVLLLLLQVAQPVLNSAILRAMRGDAQQMSLIFTLLNFVIYVLKAGGSGALIYAVFADRPGASAQAAANPWDAARQAPR